MTPFPVRRVSPTELRQMFNDGHFWERVQQGTLRCVVQKSRHCRVPPVGEPLCTHSQIACYYDQDDEEVARVHQYRRPDGTIGASGRPDPKRLLVNGTVFIV